MSFVLVSARLVTFGANRVSRYILWKHEKRLCSSGAKGSPDENYSAGKKKSLMRKYVPITVGIGLLGFYISRRIRPETRKPDSEASKWEIKIYTLLPLRFVSRIWGTVTNIDLPVFLRPKIYSLYANSFGVNLEECEIQDLTCYRSLSEFFIRPIREECRPIDHDCKCIVSPADGRVLTFGKIMSCQVEQVKGVTYSLQQFLGKQSWKDVNNNKTTNGLNGFSTKESLSINKDGNDIESIKGLGRILALSGLGRSRLEAKNEEVDPSQNDVYIKKLKEKQDTELYQCVVYLAPGDYHRFHSPVSWKVNFRRHFQGKLLSVNPAIASWIGNLFSLNERAVYIGSWYHGFFSLTAVGATNVGSIKVRFDPTLRTNQWRNTPNVRDCFFNEKDCKGDGVNRNSIGVSKGELFGEFRLGSTIVLIFEAPKNFHFNLESGQRVKYGQKIGLGELEDSEQEIGRILTRSEASTCLTCIGSTFQYVNGTKMFAYPNFAYIAMKVVGRNISDINVLQSFDHVIYLDLTNNCLTDDSLEPLGTMKQLKALIIDKNRVECAASIPKLNNLQLLSIKENYLTTCEVRELENLLYLDLSYNSIDTIMPDLWCPYILPKLTELSIRGNELKNMRGFLFSNLVSLFLGDNKITKLDGIKMLCNLEFLHLRNNPLNNLSGFSAENKKLFYLNIRDCRIEREDELKKLKVLLKLERIVVQGNPVWAEAENPRLKLLAILPRLRRINKETVGELERQTVEVTINDGELQDKEFSTND